MVLQSPAHSNSNGSVSDLRNNGIGIRESFSAASSTFAASPITLPQTFLANNTNVDGIAEGQLSKSASNEELLQKELQEARSKIQAIASRNQELSARLSAVEDAV